MESFIAPLNFFNIVIYFIPGFFTYLNFITWLKIFKLQFNLPIFVEEIEILIIIVLSVTFGVLIEGIRVHCFKYFYKLNKIKRFLPSMFTDNLNTYEKYYNRIFFVGNFSYNLCIPIIINPFIFFILKSRFCTIQSFISAIFVNILLTWFCLFIGYVSESKFYRIMKISDSRQSLHN